jgi:hypothetical protein
MGKRQGIDADKVLEAQLEYLRSGHASPRRRKLEAKLANLLPKLHTAESDMRRAFNRWEGYRELVRRTEKNLDALDREQMEGAEKNT